MTLATKFVEIIWNRIHCRFSAWRTEETGAVGIARTFMRAGEHGDGIEGAVGHIHKKLLNLRGLMYTDGAREIAKRRHALLEQFVDCLEDEIESGPISPTDSPVQSGNTSSPRI